MRKVYLDELPKKGKQFNWKESIGHKVNFIYDNVVGDLEILDCKNSYLTLRYQNVTHDIFTGDFKDCKIGKLIGLRTSLYSYDCGDSIENLNAGRLKILKKLRKGKKNYKYYYYKCLDCGNLDYISESGIKRKNGCNVCGKQKVKRGINDIATTHPEISRLLWKDEESYKYSKGSNKKVDWKCSRCGTKIIKKSINNIVNQGLSCPMCSDGISIPEKFIFAMFAQTPCIYETQKVFSWSKNIIHDNRKLCGSKIYDGFLPQYGKILEIHGRHHYLDSIGFTKLTLKEIQENDRMKTELANKNGLSVITINAKESELNHLKHSILSSELVKIFDLSNIDWEKCWEITCGSLVQTACKFHCDGLSLKEICSEMRLHKDTVRNYLKIGSRIGWCKYNAKEMRNRFLGVGAHFCKRKVILLSLNNTLVDTFNSITEASEHTGVPSSNICKACKGMYKSAGGYKWMYKEDYEDYIEQQL